MRILRVVALLLGLVMEPFGFLFLLQGMGIVRWPASSFMIDQSAWVIYGAVIAGLGFGLLLWGGRGLSAKRD